MVIKATQLRQDMTIPYGPEKKWRSMTRLSTAIAVRSNGWFIHSDRPEVFEICGMVVVCGAQSM